VSDPGASRDRRSDDPARDYQEREAAPETLVADYILKQREYFEYPLDLEQPGEECGQKGDGHDRYDQDDEELSLTHASIYLPQLPLSANT
jgi:hypothetical protein